MVKVVQQSTAADATVTGLNEKAKDGDDDDDDDRDDDADDMIRSIDRSIDRSCCFLVWRTC